MRRFSKTLKKIEQWCVLKQQFTELNPILFQIILTLTGTQMKMFTAYFQHLVENLKTF